MRIPKFFLICYLIVFILGIIVVSLIEKGTIVLWINQHLNYPLLNTLFKYLTYLGDGVILAIIGVVSLFYKYKYAIVIALSSLFQILLVHINKRVLFKDLKRPKAYFEDLNIKLDLIPGVETHSHHSFPSGHTATIFAICVILSLAVSKKKWEIALLILAMAVGYSRIHLLQHFFIDVLFGSVIGIISVVISIWIFQYFFKNKEALEKGLINT